MDKFVTFEIEKLSKNVFDVKISFTIDELLFHSHCLQFWLILDFLFVYIAVNQNQDVYKVI